MGKRRRARVKARRDERNQRRVDRITARGEKKQGIINARWLGRNTRNEMRTEKKIKTQWSGTIKTIAIFGGIALVGIIALKIFKGVKK